MWYRGAVSRNDLLRVGTLRVELREVGVLVGKAREPDTRPQNVGRLPRGEHSVPTRRVVVQVVVHVAARFGGDLDVIAGAVGAQCHVLTRPVTTVPYPCEVGGFAKGGQCEKEEGEEDHRDSLRLMQCQQF